MILYYIIDKYNKKDKLVKKGKKRRAKSFVKAFMSFLACWTVPGAYTSENTGASVQAVGTGSTYQDIGLTLPRTSSAYGIVVGSNSTAVASTNYALGTIIGSVTTLEYGPHICDRATTTVGNIVTFNMSRIFRNVHATNSYTINEIGYYNHSGTQVHCLIRDVVSPGQVVAPGEYIKVTYTVQITA